MTEEVKLLMITETSKFKENMFHGNDIKKTLILLITSSLNLDYMSFTSYLIYFIQRHAHINARKQTLWIFVSLMKEIAKGNGFWGFASV